MTGHPHQGHRGTRAIQRMVEYAPSTGGLALWVRHHDLGHLDDAMPQAPLIATDGDALYYAAAFKQLPLGRQVGLVAHEVLHIALRHAQRYTELRQRLGDVDLALFNACADAVINSTLGHLSWLDLSPGAVTLDALLADVLKAPAPVEKLLLEWDVERLYRAIDDRRPARTGRLQQQDGPASATQARMEAGRAADSASGPPDPRIDGPRAARARALAGQEGAPDLLPGDDGGGAPEREAEEARAWGERLLRAHAGDGAHSMLRTLIADVHKVHTPWEQVLRTQLARALALQPDLSWSRPSRSYLANQGRCGPRHRMPFEPGVTPTRSVPRLAVIVDVSGSIEDALMARFAREIEAMARRLGAGVVLVVGDQRVERVLRYEPGRCRLGEIEFQGGGGTDFTPLLEEADAYRPDIVVVLTDLQGAARHRPRCPVLWAVPEAWASADAPFGRKLVLQ